MLPLMGLSPGRCCGTVPCMAPYVCRFPDGAAGVGLMVLRASGAAALVNAVLAVQTGWAGDTAMQGLVGTLSFALLAGLGTRPVSVLIGMAMLVGLFLSTDPLLLAGPLGGYAALVLMGPGAYSVDARLHGRKVVHLRARRLDRGEDP